LAGDTPARGRPPAGPRLRTSYEGDEMVLAGELDMYTAVQFRAVLAGRAVPTEGYRLDLTGLTYIDGRGRGPCSNLYPSGCGYGSHEARPWPTPCVP